MTVSILIPSHNRVRLLKRTLSSLREVEISEDVEAEVIVTANACTDGTLDMLAGLETAYPHSLRFFHEETPGANIARNRCLREAEGEILAFVDDDIQFDSGWLKGLQEVFETYDADVVGGRIELWWEEVEKPDWLTPELAHILSAYELGDCVKEVDRPGPVGANVALRRSVYEVLGPMHTGIQDENNSINRGDEVEYLRRAGRADFKAYYAPDALVHHWVSPDRIEADFFEKAGQGFGHSRINMKETFGPLTACRSLAGFSYLAFKHGVGAQLARVRGNKADHFQQLYTQNIGIGGLRGTLARLRRRLSDGS